MAARRMSYTWDLVRAICVISLIALGIASLIELVFKVLLSNGVSCP